MAKVVSVLMFMVVVESNPEINKQANFRLVCTLHY